jgi:hypothetical protein
MWSSTGLYLKVKILLDMLFSEQRLLHTIMSNAGVEAFYASLCLQERGEVGARQDCLGLLECLVVWQLMEADFGDG